MNPKFLKNDPASLLSKVVEEAGEVLAAIGKTQIFGFDSYNPYLPPHERETNEDWIMRELKDLKFHIERLENHVLERKTEKNQLSGANPNGSIE